LVVSARPLVFLTGLTIGDYLLWNWSLNGNHDVLALISGLSLPPLAVAWLWLLALTGARLLAGITQRPSRRSARGAARRGARARPAPAAATAPVEEAADPSARSAGQSSSKLAA
jgi:hypothetical protein